MTGVTSNRRAVLKTGSVALLTGGFGGCLGGSRGSPESADSGGPTTTVEVGPSGELRFDPPTLEIPPGTTVRWVWKSDNHNVIPESQPDGANWSGTDGGKGTVYNTGHEYSHSFETTGTYEYSCYPHKAAGMVGTIDVSESATAPTTGDDHESTETEDGTTDQETETATALDLPVEVGPSGRLEFAPTGDRPLVVESGTTVEFVWRSDNHNVVVDAQPEDADWQGTPGGPDKFYDKGYTYAHTFDAPGTYEFHCAAHEEAGMEGTIVVRESVPTPNYATEADLPVQVGPNGNLTFAPGTDRPLKISAGTEIRFVWESDSHNVVVEDQPEGADWEGTPGAPSKVYDAGYEYSHVFETPGVYEFYCRPHKTVGMKGKIVVTGE